MDTDGLADAIETMAHALRKRGKFTVDMEVEGFSMSEGSACGCFAGLWGWSLGDYREWEEWEDYEEMANNLAKHLGFEDCFDLRHWAGENPKIWGNTRGKDMFLSADAFGIGKNANAREVIEHLIGVYERLEAGNPCAIDVRACLEVSQASG